MHSDSGDEINKWTCMYVLCTHLKAFVVKLNSTMQVRESHKRFD